jgi:hypothetical protein
VSPPAGQWTVVTVPPPAPRAQDLLIHPDPLVRNFAAETLREIEVFEISAGSYGYVFYALQLF